MMVGLLALSSTAQDVLPELSVPKPGGVTKVTNAKVVKVEPDGLRVVHDGGLIKVPYESIPEAWKGRYTFDAKEAAAFREKSGAQQIEALKRMDQEQGQAKQLAHDDKVKQKMDNLRDAGLVSKVVIRQVTDDGFLGDGVYLEVMPVTVPGNALNPGPKTVMGTGKKSLGYIFVHGDVASVVRVK